MQGYRRTGERLPRPPAHRRLALPPVGPTYPETHQGSRIVSGAAILAVAAKRDGQREIVDLGLGPSGAETFWMDFPRGLHTRGLEGTKPGDRRPWRP
ncbi:MAG: transposase [Rhodobacteraceae bacterium]|nr:transposase [Paracoccaceae bacterium]